MTRILTVKSASGDQLHVAVQAVSEEQFGFAARELRAFASRHTSSSLILNSGFSLTRREALSEVQS